MLLLTSAEIQEVMAIIRKAHTAFIANTLNGSIADAYVYGQLLEQLNNPTVQNMSYDQFKQWVAKNPIPLTPIEQEAIKSAQQRAGQFCRGLGNRVDAQTGQILIEVDAQLRAQMRDTIKTKVAENIARRQSLKKLKSELGWATRDWARDWDRIAITEKHMAHQEGVKDQIAKRYGSDATVFKRSMPDACKHCQRLHNGPDGHPRLFLLKDLEDNGTNVGRKAADWLPVVGAVHPHCQCQLVRMPDGWGFDEDGNMSPTGEYGVMHKAETLRTDLLEEDQLVKAIRAGGRIEFQKLPILVENPAGSKRKWCDAQGNSGETLMIYAYGEIIGTDGADGDPVDVFIGPDPKAKNAYIVHQQDPVGGRYDEDKVMLGFSSEQQAINAYQAHYNRPDFIATCTPMAMDAFKRWVQALPTTVANLQKTKGERLIIPLPELEKGFFSRKQKRGPFLGKRGGRWADPEHTIPWREDVPTFKHPMTSKQQMIEAAHRAAAAGADPKTMKLVGAGMEGILFKDASGKTFKVWRPRPGSKRTLAGEAKALEALQGTPAAKYLPKFHSYNKEHNVIVREHVEGREAKKFAEVREAWEAVAAETEKLGLGVPEFNETGFIIPETGDPIMIDLGDLRPRGSSPMHKSDDWTKGAQVEKALVQQRVSQEQGAFTSQAGNRAPSVSSGANWAFGKIPEFHKPQIIEGQGSMRATLEEAQPKTSRGIYRDKEIYDVNADAAKVAEARPIIPLYPKEVLDGARDDVEYRRQRIEEEKERKAKKLAPNRRPLTIEDVQLKKKRKKKPKKGTSDETETDATAEGVEFVQSR